MQYSLKMHAKELFYLLQKNFYTINKEIKLKKQKYNYIL